MTQLLGHGEPAAEEAEASPERDLLAELDLVRARARSTGCRVLLVGVALSNAGEVAGTHGVGTLEAVTDQLVDRALAGLAEARLLRLSGFGGFLLALPVREAAMAQCVATLTGRMRDFVQVDRCELWPVVTSAVRVCGDEAAADLVSDVRTTLREAVGRTPGSTRWCTPAPPRPPGSEDLVRDLAWTLRTAPEQLALHYQPVRSLTSGTVLGTEALLRWTHPVHGPIDAMDAVRAAERSGLVHDLGRWVLASALRQAASWRAAGHDLVVHVNVSAFQLREPTFAKEVASFLTGSGVPPATLLLELTESELSDGDPDVVRSLEVLRSSDVRLGIDDFGTGYSSIAQLSCLPVDTVKVDRSLVRGIATSSADLDLLSTVLSLLAGTGLAVVAEGIESSVQAAHLRALGCPAGQGYHLGRPAPAAEVLPGA